MNRLESDFFNTEPLKSSINKLNDIILQHINEYDGEKKWNLYIHIIPKELSGYDHDKYYVGVTNDVKRRWRNKGSEYSKLMFFNAIKKYGWNNIVHIVLFENLYEKLCYMLEKELINMLHTIDRHYGYNRAEGGYGGDRKGTRRIRQYTSEGKFIKEWNSAAEAGRYYKRDRTLITFAIRHHRRFMGYQWTYDDVLEIGSFVRKKPVTKNPKARTYGNNSNAKAILCLNTGERFSTIKEASEKYNINYDRISKHCRGIYEYAGKDDEGNKLIWKFCK